MPTNLHADLALQPRAVGTRPCLLGWGQAAARLRRGAHFGHANRVRCVLSAYSINAADAVEERQSPATDVWNNDDDAKHETRFPPLIKEATKVLNNQGYPKDVRHPTRCS